jgi:hypothetical protein
MTTTKESTSQPAAKQESPVSAAPLLRPFDNLGRRLGNASMRALLQAKLTVSNPDDIYEQEADRVADQVMRMPVSSLVQRRCTKCEDEVHRAADATAGVPTVDDATEQSIQGLSGRGAPLSNSVRSFMESRFDADFSHVRIHTDSHAQGLARAVDAQAFTVGRNVVFGAGRYDPDTERGKRLLAHELTHVVQQTGAGARQTIARQANLLLPERKPTVDDWLRRTRDFRQLEILDLQEGIDLLSQHQSFQNRSTADDLAIEQTLASLRAELNRRSKAADHKGPSNKSRKSATPPPTKHPRVLSEKGAVYSGPEEQRAEYNLIMKWLARDDLPAKDRKVLAKERQFLEQQLLTDRQQLAAERHAAKVQAALAPGAGDEASKLLSMARTIEGIGKDPHIPDIRYIYYRGERYTIGSAQAKSLHETLTKELKHVVNRIESNAGMERERYDVQVKINREHRFAAFWSGVIGGAKDPGGEVSATYVAVMAVYRQAHADLAAGRLVQAASRVSRLEQLTNELRAMSRGFQEDHIKGAERAVTTLEFTRDAAFAVAGSIAAVVAAPLVAGYATGLGLSGVGAGVFTTLGTSGMVGGGMALVRGTSAAVGTAAAGGSLRNVAGAFGSEAWRGFREGAISGAGGGAMRAIAPLLGVGASAGVQFARRAAGEAIVNGTTTMLDVLWQGGSIKAAAAAGVRSALLSIPGSAVGSLNSRAAKFLLAPMTASATAYAGAILAGESVEVAIARAGTAMATSLSIAAAKHGGAADAALVNKGKAAGERTKAAAIAAKKRVADKAWLIKNRLSDPRELGIEKLPADTGPDLPRTDATTVHHDDSGTPQPLPPHTPPEVEVVIPRPGEEPSGPHTADELTGDRVVVPPVPEGGLPLAPHDWDHIPTQDIQAPPPHNWDHIPTDPGTGAPGGSSGGPTNPPPPSAAPPASPAPSKPPTPEATPRRPVQQQQQQQQTRIPPREEEPTPRVGPTPARLRPEEGGEIGPIMRAIVFVSGKNVRAIVVHGNKPHYQSLGKSPSGMPGKQTYKTPGRWYHFLGIQEFETERKHMLKPRSLVGRRGWYIKGKRVTDQNPNAALDNVALEVEFETSSPEQVNKWLFDQGAECFIAYEHNGLLRPEGEPPPIPRPPVTHSDDDTLP